MVNSHHIYKIGTVKDLIKFSKFEIHKSLIYVNILDISTNLPIRSVLNLNL